MKLNFSLRNTFVISNLFRVIMLLSAGGSILEKNYLNVLTAMIAFGLSYLPYLLRKRRFLYLPVQFQVVITLFFFSSLYLGSIKGYYLRYWWWDIMLHTSSGFILGLVGFVLVYTLNSHKGKTVSLSPFFIAMFAFNFAITIGALWEIYEFTMDSVFGWSMQKSGLIDTMWDLIVDMIGAAVSAIYGYIYVKEHNRRKKSRKKHHDLLDEINEFENT